jgi:hypothetical protein
MIGEGRKGSSPAVGRVLSFVLSLKAMKEGEVREMILYFMRSKRPVFQ